MTKNIGNIGKIMRSHFESWHHSASRNAAVMRQVWPYIVMVYAALVYVVMVYVVMAYAGMVYVVMVV